MLRTRIELRKRQYRCSATNPTRGGRGGGGGEEEYGSSSSSYIKNNQELFTSSNRAQCKYV